MDEIVKRRNRNDRMEQLQKFLDEAENPRDDLHAAYKNNMKSIIRIFLNDLISDSDNFTDDDLDFNDDYVNSFIDKWVEDHFRKE